MSNDTDTAQIGSDSTDEDINKRLKYAVSALVALLVLSAGVFLLIPPADDPAPNPPTEAPPEPTETETETPTTEEPTDPTTDEPTEETISGLVDIAPNHPDSGVYVQYQGNETLSTSKARIVINGTENVDGTYPASQFLENDTFTNETMYLNEDTLDDTLPLVDGTEITFEYNLNGEWRPITKATFSDTA